MYVAARGGEAAIQRAEQLYRAMLGDLTLETVHTIQEQMPYLLDRVMGEASLYAPELAALALAQTGGDLYEAVLLLRAYRSTQPRIAYATPTSAENVLTVRRISAAFKDIPGGQILGPSLDYSHRLLRLDVLDGVVSEEEAFETAEQPAPPTYPTVADWQRENSLLPRITAEQIEPVNIPDVTTETCTTSGAKSFWKREKLALPEIQNVKRQVMRSARFDVRMNNLSRWWRNCC